MKILFINNDGGGFADYIEVTEGLTVQQLFDRQLRDAKPENYLIRVSGRPAARDQVLVEGDRVSMTPTKIEGAWTQRELHRCKLVTRESNARAGCHPGSPPFFFCGGYMHSTRAQPKAIATCVGHAPTVHGPTRPQSVGRTTSAIVG